jgi:hypothetical protein
MRMEPETRYARSGDVSIAYQVLGEGPFDVVHVQGFVTHVPHARSTSSLSRRSSSSGMPHG